MKTSVYNIFGDYQQEEEWLNEMAAKGWHLTHANIPKYTFEEGLPGEYIHRITLTSHSSRHPDTINYIRFMEEAGAQHVASNWQWVYFRRKADLGEFTILTDTSSLVQHYKRVRNILFWTGLTGIIGAATQIPFIVWALFMQNSMWGMANIVSAAICIFSTYCLWKPARKYSAKVKDLKFQQEIFE